MTLEGNCSSPIQNGELESAVVRFQPNQSERLAAVLGHALYDDPRIRHVLPNNPERQRVLPRIIFNAIHWSHRYGEIYTTSNVDGGALWIGPDGIRHRSDILRIVRLSALTLGASRRLYTELLTHLVRVHRQVEPQRHWYLMALGASLENHEIRGKLIEPILRRADLTGLPCYLETFNERILPLFERYGFRIAAGGRVPGGGPDFWAMTRRPRAI